MYAATPSLPKRLKWPVFEIKSGPAGWQGCTKGIERCRASEVGRVCEEHLLCQAADIPHECGTTWKILLSHDTTIWHQTKISLTDRGEGKTHEHLLIRQKHRLKLQFRPADGASSWKDHGSGSLVSSNQGRFCARKLTFSLLT